MFCSKCGSDLPKDSEFCSSCGDNQKPPLKPKRRMPFWFILLFGITLIGVGAGFYSAFNSLGGMGQAAQDQLDAIKTNQMTKAYYGYTSKDFQSSTSLDSFRKYVKAHPVLIHNAEAIFHTRSFDDNIGILEGMLTAKNGSTIPVRYQLVKEDNQWKVLNMELGKENPTIRKATPFPVSNNTSDQELQQPIKNQLQAIRSGNYAQAYNDFTSEDFRASTSLEKFETFIDSYPILTRYKEVAFKDKEVQGDRAQIVALFASDDGVIPAEYKLVKEGGTWKVWSLHLLLLPNGDQELTEVDSEQLLVPVSQQLTQLKSGDIETAYNDAASGFKVATSLADFKEFVKNFPAFANDKATIKGHYFDKGTGKVNVELENVQGVSLLEYTLTKEDGKWKVWGMRVADLPPNSEPLTEKETTEFDKSELLKPIEEQLSAIRSGDYTKAYTTYTSTAFKQATTQEQFDQFLNNYAAFKENVSSSFDNLTFEGNVGIYTGILKAKGGATIPVEFDLVKEEGNWKILSIKVLATKPQPQGPIDPSKPLEFTALAIGTEVDLSGEIVNPATTFPLDIKDIYATLTIANGTSGDQIQVIFEHVPTSSQIPPVSATLEQNGSSNLSFIFTPPASGWPPGDYVIKVSSASGVNKSFPFKLSK